METVVCYLLKMQNPTACFQYPGHPPFFFFNKPHLAPVWSLPPFSFHPCPPSLCVCMCVWVGQPSLLGKRSKLPLFASLPLSPSQLASLLLSDQVGGQSTPTAAAAAGMFCVVWTFSRCGGPTHTHRGLHVWYSPRLSLSLPLFHIHTHTQKERRCVSGGSRRVESTEERSIEEKWGAEQQTLQCQGRENGWSAASLSVSGAGVLCCCLDCFLCMHMHTVSYRKLSLLTATLNRVAVFA